MLPLMGLWGLFRDIWVQMGSRGFRGVYIHLYIYIYRFRAQVG